MGPHPFVIAVAACALVGCAIPGWGPRTEPATIRAYVNAQIWNGKEFQPGSLIVQNGVFVENDAALATETTDLAGAYVLPPFCDAHSHDIQSSFELENTLARLRGDGVAYVKVLSSIPEYSAEIRRRLNRADGVEAAFAGPPITGPGGHPIPLQLRLHGHGAYPGVTVAELDGFARIVVQSKPEIEAAWPGLIARRPDFIKIMLLDSANHQARVGRPEAAGLTGLDPALAPEIVALAHAAGLRVSAHVDTAADFGVAVAAGVDEIAHLPGRRTPEVITPDIAAGAARAGIVVVTTAGLAASQRERNPALFAQIRAAQAESLRNLRRSKVTLALGTDSHGSVHDEAAYLDALGVFERAELLAMMTKTCAATTFPGRNIGGLAPGMEASFVAIEADPLADLAALRHVRLLVKARR